MKLRACLSLSSEALATMLESSLPFCILSSEPSDLATPDINCMESRVTGGGPASEPRDKYGEYNEQR